MDNIRKQKMIASILLDIGLDDDIIEVITSLSKEEIKQINKKTKSNYLIMLLVFTILLKVNIKYKTIKI